MSGYVAMPTPVTASPEFWNQGLQGLNALRDYQAKQATAQIYQQSIDPSTGQIDQGKFNALLAANPRAAWNAGQTMQQQGAAQSAQAVGGANQVAGRLAQLKVISGEMTDLLQSGQPVTADQVKTRLNSLGQQGIITPAAMQGILADLGTQPPGADLSGWLRNHMATNQSATEQLQNVTSQPYHYSIGGADVVAEGNPRMPGYRAPGSVTPFTLTPEGVMSQGIVYPATEEDVAAGRASRPGQDVHISGPDVVKRFGAGGLLPPGGRVDTSAGGGGGGGVVDSSGKPVGPNNQPRLLNVPGPTPPASGTTPPAPPGGSPAAPATGGSVGFGAAIGGPQPATGASAMPVPPVPPPNAPTAPVPMVHTSPTLRGPGTPVPPAPTGGPLGASLGGGVPVASANPLLVPTTGAPSPPSPLVPGDVNAIMAGMRRGATPAPGTQVAAAFGVGPGTEQAQGYKTSADKLANDDLAAASFQNTQFPYVQALKNYGEGTKTGPGTDFWNQVAGSIRTPLAKIGVDVGPLSDTTQRVDALGKWLASIQSANPVSSRSDAELAQVLKGSASTHINEVAGEDMVKAGLALQRMNVAANREWHSNPALQRQYGTYLNFLGSYNNTVDPRAFMVDTLNPAQVQRLRSQLQNGSEADAQRFETTLALARRNGMIGGGGSQAMP